MPEFVNIVEKSASENAKSLKHVFKSKMKSLKEKKWKKQRMTWPASKDPREASCRLSYHQQMVIK